MTSTNVSREKTKEIAEKYIVSTTEVISILGCSRQYIHQLTKSGKLIPIKTSGKENLYYRPDIESLRNKRTN